MTVFCYAIQLFRYIDFAPFLFYNALKESNGDEVMKNVNVQHEVEYCQNNEKIGDLCPPVCMSVRERNPLCGTLARGSSGRRSST